MTSPLFRSLRQPRPLIDARNQRSHRGPVLAMARVLGFAAVFSAGAGSAAAQAPASSTPQPPRLLKQALEGTTVEFDMVFIPGGKTSVPDPTAASGMREVDVAPFWISATETTWDAYDIFVYRLDEPDPEAPLPPDAVSRPSKPYIPPDRGFGHAGYPVISVTAHGAREFAAWLTKKTGHPYRLPTEAEWQVAALAGASGAYCFGDDPAALPEYAWFEASAGDKTRPVAKKKPNAWGLYDMHGNAAEWCLSLDGKPVARGGSYNEPATAITAQARRRQDPSWNKTDPQFPKSSWWLSDGPFMGLRVVREARPGDAGPPAAPAPVPAPTSGK